MNTEVLDIITYIASLFPSLLLAVSMFVMLYKSRSERNKLDTETQKTGADASASISEAAMALLEPLKKRIEEVEAEKSRMEKDLRARITTLESRMDELEKELREKSAIIDDLTSGAIKLYHQVQSLGGVPVYVPPAKKGKKDNAQ